MNRDETKAVFELIRSGHWRTLLVLAGWQDAAGRRALGDALRLSAGWLRKASEDQRAQPAAATRP